MTIILGQGIFYVVDVETLPEPTEEFFLELQIRSSGVYKLTRHGETTIRGKSEPLFLMTRLRDFSVGEGEKAITTELVSV